MSKILKLALLVTDTPAPRIVEQYGDYYVQFSKFLQKVIASSEISIGLDMKPYNVTKMEYPGKRELLEIDGMIITGSGMKDWFIVSPSILKTNMFHLLSKLHQRFMIFSLLNNSPAFFFLFFFH